MSELKPANFKLSKFKKTGAGIEATWNETIVLGNDVSTVNEVSAKSKDDPHPELQKALNALEEIVLYDEGYSDDVDLTIIGVSISGKDGDVAKITHTKNILSGSSGGRNSGRIHKGSEEFEKAELLFTLLDKLAHEVYMFFIKNKRSQLQLFDSGEGKENGDKAA